MATILVMKGSVELANEVSIDVTNNGRKPSEIHLGKEIKSGVVENRAGSLTSILKPIKPL